MATAAPPESLETLESRPTVTGGTGGAGVASAVGARIGKFLVLDLVGQGATGMVFAAYDADLDRKIAIKILMRGDDESARRQDRMMREARALARLSHPNVLAIHEVGTVGDTVYLATEFAAGGTLRRWSETSRPWREVIDVFVQAGRGLMAAHQAGLVHRDFKPENVLRTADGRVCVADFGLVGYEASTDRPAGDGRDDDVALTSTGTVMGTPAYMAPEQHRGEAVGPAADQFAFCASLWEALYRQRPFEGATRKQLTDNVLAGRLVAPPPNAGVPAWVREALGRGLHVDSRRRWPSMAALLAALGDGLAARRRGRLIIAVAAATAAAGAASYALTRGGAAPDTRCAEMGAPLAGVWNRERAAAMRAAFAASGRPYGALTGERASTDLDAYAGRWVSVRTAACRATHVGGEQSGELLDLKMACLERRRQALDALLAVLTANVTGDIVDKAVTSVGKLAPIDGCTDDAALRAAIPPPSDPGARSAVEQLRAALARAKAFIDAGDLGRATTALVTDDVVGAAERLGYAPLRAEALHLRGMLEAAAGDPAAADATLERAVVVASEARDDDLVARSWDERLFVIGVLRGLPDEALRFRSAAEAAVKRAGNPPLLEARLVHNLGNVLETAERHADAIPMFERAVAMKSQVFGPDRPEVAGSLNGLAVATMGLGRLDEAAVHLDRALAIWERALGPDHPNLAGVHNNLGNIALKRRDYAAARDHHARALEIRERMFGPDHPGVADSLDNLGIALGYLGQLAEARTIQERALDIRERALGLDHYDVGYSALNLGGTYHDLGMPAEAEAAYRRALTITERTLGADDPELGLALAGLATALTTQDRGGEALPFAERGLALRDRDGSDRRELAGSRMQVGTLLAMLGRDRRRARSLVGQARAEFAELGATAEVEAADRWLARHPQ